MNNEKMNQIIDEVYSNYLKNGQQEADRNRENQTFLPMPKQMFINKIKTNDEFLEKWGLKIEERELSLEERCKLANFAPFDDRFPEDDSLFKWDEHTIGIANGWLEQHHSNLPTKLITVTYNDIKTEIYE